MTNIAEAPFLNIDDGILSLLNTGYSFIAKRADQAPTAIKAESMMINILSIF